MRKVSPALRMSPFILQSDGEERGEAVIVVFLGGVRCVFPPDRTVNIFI